MVKILANADGVQAVTLEGADAVALNDLTWPVIAKEIRRLDRILRARKRKVLRSL